HGVEIANGETATQALGLPFWNDVMNGGRHVVAVGGSDSHNPDVSAVGLPATVVWANRLSETSLVEGLKSGRVYIRTAHVDRPVLDYSATSRTNVVPMGGAISPGPIVLHAGLGSARGQECRWYRRGQLVQTMPIQSDDAELDWPVEASSGDWFMLAVQDGDQVTLVSNPIFVS